MKKYVCLFLLLCAVSMTACKKSVERVPEESVQPEGGSEAEQEENPDEGQQGGEELPVTCMMDLWGDGTEEERAYAEFIDELRFEEGVGEMMLDFWLPITQYALLDINQDGTQELALASVGIEHPEEEPFRNYFVYSYDKGTKEINRIYMEIMYQGTFQYSADYQALVYKGEMFWDLPEGVESFYELQQMGGLGEGVKPLYEFFTMEKVNENYYRKFTVGSQNTADTTLYYTEGAEEREISEEEYESCLADVADIPFSDILVPPSRELSGYLGQKLAVLLEQTGEELQEGEDEGEWKRLENDTLAVLIEPDTEIIQMIEMHMGSGHTVEGIRLLPDLMRGYFGAEYLLKQNGWEEETYDEGDAEYVNSSGQRLILHVQELEGEDSRMGVLQLENIRVYAPEKDAGVKPEYDYIGEVIYHYENDEYGYEYYMVGTTEGTFSLDMQEIRKYEELFKLGNILVFNYDEENGGITAIDYASEENILYLRKQKERYSTFEEDMEKMKDMSAEELMNYANNMFVYWTDEQIYAYQEFLEEEGITSEIENYVMTAEQRQQKQ